MLWWGQLGAIAVLNISLWVYSARVLARKRSLMSHEAYSVAPPSVAPSAGYVFGCAFRSFLPVFDVPRVTLVDSWVSSAMVGRSVATVAELCFAIQWALLTRETARATGSLYAHVVARLVVPMLAVAEACSWYSVLTTSNLGHVFEESLWGLCAALVVVSMVMIRPRCTPIPRSVVVTWCVLGAAYVAYMFLVDVPMYWERWVADQAAGREYFTIVQGVLDASSSARRDVQLRALAHRDAVDVALLQCRGVDQHFAHPCARGGGARGTCSLGSVVNTGEMIESYIALALTPSGIFRPSHPPRGAGPLLVSGIQLSDDRLARVWS